MLICKKDFLQYKEGDYLPLKLDKKVAKQLIKDGLAEEIKISPNKKVEDYIQRTKDNPKKNYKRKVRGKNKKKV